MRAVPQPVVINGSHGEGGGALFRTAVAMSAITQQPVRIHNVRGAMRKPGLTAEDMACLAILGRSTKAETVGDELGNDAVTFAPGRAARAVDTEFDLQSLEAGRTHGSAVIVAQSLAPVLATTGAYSYLKLLGETHASQALGFDAFQSSLCPVMAALGVGVYPALVTAGLGTGSKGEIFVEVEPSAFEPLRWATRGEVAGAGCVVTSVDTHPKAVQEAIETAASLLEKAGLPGEVTTVETRGPEPGLAVTFWVRASPGGCSGSAMTQKPIRPGVCVAQAWEPVEKWLEGDATVDTFLADQILLACCLAEGRSQFSTPMVTRRLTTVAWVVKQFVPIHVTVRGREGTPGVVTVER